MRKLLTVGTVGLIGMGLFAGSVSAETEERAIDEKWGKPVFVHGDALSNKQVEDMMESFNITNDNSEKVEITGKDLVNYLEDGDPNSNMYSSALIERKDEGYGVKVEIDTPENITKIGENQYSNAMITAGVTDASVHVASPIKVTGESALTGIYKAYESQGELLDKDRMGVAQDELDTTAQIADASKDNEEFSQDKLDDALIEIKQELAKKKDGATKEEVEEIVNKALDKRGLDKAISQENVNKLVSLADKYSKTDAVNSKEVTDQLKDLSKDVANKLGDWKDKAEEKGVFEAIGNFFRDLFNAIGNFFKAIFN